MERRKFSRVFKIEGAKMVSERGVSVAQASRDLDVHQTVRRKWVKEVSRPRREAFRGHGQMKPEQQEIQRKRCFPPTLHDVVIEADVGRHGSPQPYERTGHPRWSWSGACPPP